MEKDIKQVLREVYYNQSVTYKQIKRIDDIDNDELIDFINEEFTIEYKLGTGDKKLEGMIKAFIRNLPWLEERMGAHKGLLLSSINILKVVDKIDLEEIMGKDYQDFIKYINKPDEIENDLYTYKGHFYDPDLKCSYIKGNVNAYNRFKEHYNNALNKYKENNRNDAYKELAMTLHYLSDLNSPHHAANKIALKTDHCRFEKYIDKNLNEFIIKNNEIKNLYDNIFVGSEDEIAMKSAIIAKSLYSDAIKDYHLIAKKTCENVQYAICIVIKKFLNRVA
ncbi:MAG: hypothetical protein ABF289_09315 [Clostridiales bacterium]